MKNITASVPDDVHRRARIRAAERDTSVSALVAQYLRELDSAVDDQEFDRPLGMERDAIAQVSPGLSARDDLSRDELHDRALMRRVSNPFGAD